MQFKLDTSAQAETLPPPKPPVHKDRVVYGMAASAASFLMLNTMNVFAKLLSTHHYAIEVAFYRNFIAVIPFAIYIFFFGRRDLLKIHSRFDTIVLRSTIGTISLIATFKAFNALPMADAQALFFTSSLFVPILGYFLLKEKVGPYRWSAVLIGFLGMLVMVRPSGAVNLAGAGFAHIGCAYACGFRHAPARAWPDRAAGNGDFLFSPARHSDDLARHAVRSDNTHLERCSFAHRSRPCGRMCSDASIGGV